LEAPLHLWAAKNGQIERGPAAFDQHLMDQGRMIEELALAYLEGTCLKGKGEVSIQKTFSDGPFQIRTDAVAADPNGGWLDIYEVKSSTSIKKEHYYDLTYQRLVCEASMPVRDVYLVYVNKEYVLGETFNAEDFFLVENLTQKVEEFRAEVLAEREYALETIRTEAPNGIATCFNPGSCPCPALCHAELPAYPIYNLPRLGAKRAKDLRDQGVLGIKEIPAGYSLSERQQEHLLAVQSGEPRINKSAIMDALNDLIFPLYFLDYETYPPGLPLFPGYKPYEHVVFQYSLHVMDNEGSLDHHELLLTGEGDPSRELAADLLEKIAEKGAVIVWNKGFEMGKNREMGMRYPQYKAGFEAVNDRVYDLMEIFSKGLYIDADFGGSASLKAVLPVLVPELETSYQDLAISGGDQAMLAWRDIREGKVPDSEIPRLREALLAYCKLDTLAMVEIWRTLLAQI
jgi:hypothetical protein